jgi:WD40 repeat protein
MSRPWCTRPITRLASAGGDSGVRVWDLGKQPGTRTFAEFPTAVGSFAVAADGSRSVVGPRSGASPDGSRITILDAAGKPIRTISGTGDVALSRDGRRVACGRPGGGVAVCDADTGNEIWSRAEATPSGGSRVAQSPDGARIAFWSANLREITIQSLTTGSHLTVPGVPSACGDGALTDEPRSREPRGSRRAGGLNRVCSRQ